MRFLKGVRRVYEGCFRPFYGKKGVYEKCMKTKVSNIVGKKNEVTAKRKTKGKECCMKMQWRSEKQRQANVVKK